MTYTEIKKRNKKKYFYRVKSVRNGKKVSKKRIYLGVNLTKKQLFEKELSANKKLLKNKADKGIEEIRPKIIRILKKNKIKKAGIFGSYATGKQKKNSDIDILIEQTNKMGFFEIIQLEDDLKDELKKKVDLLTYSGIHKLIKNRVEKEEVRII